jgi:hypothetical protein
MEGGGEGYFPGEFFLFFLLSSCETRKPGPDYELSCAGMQAGSGGSFARMYVEC